MSNEVVTYQKEIGKLIRAERERQGNTLRAVSDTTYISVGYLSEIERGKKETSLNILDQLCTSLGLDLGEVLSTSVRTVKQTKRELVSA
jgi:transcriptional regulator with XRE-family HTH domain